MATNIFPLIIEPGIKRDGTDFSSNRWIDGKWCRFYQGKPQKMGGYQQMVGDLNNVPRGTFVLPVSPNFNVYTGDFESLKYFPANGVGLALATQTDRTPVLFSPNVYNQWTFEVMYSTINASSILLAHAAPNLYSIDQNIESPIYYGDAQATTPLVETGLNVSGGMVVLHPYLFVFGNDGEVTWTEANDPTTIMDSARVTASKIVAGLATRGGNSSPAGLLWSLDSVIRVTQVGTTSVEFAFDTVTAQSSILSSNGVIEYDSLYYWAAVDRFLVYNGQVQELPNDVSLQFFFDNLNYAERQKVWVTKYTKYGEIWWFFPRGDATECNWAVVYNVREQSWYDTPINRSSGYFDQTFSKPIWTSNDEAPYKVWRQEVGVDQNINDSLTAIESYCETRIFGWVTTGPDGNQSNTDKVVDIYRFEPDFIQSGEMSLTVKGRAYANSVEEVSGVYTFTDETEKVDLREQRREMTLNFSSNVVGGYYQMGKPLMVVRLGDTRP